MSSFSLALLNWRRKQNVIDIVNNMVKYNCINEILISNGNIEHSLKKTDMIESDKIKIFDDWIINDNYGLDRRYINALRGKNDNIIIMDDDVEISENELNKLIDEYKKNDNRIVGKWGRNIGNGYNFHDHYNDVDVVLTKLFVCKKHLFKLFFICKPLIEDIYKTGVPYGNGEDIVFSFISNIYTKNKGFCIRLQTNELPQMNTGVCKHKHHKEYRNNLCSYLIKNKSKIATFINDLQP